MFRDFTRRERYNKKILEAPQIPIELCAVNFRHDENLAYLIRAAACFGVSRIHVIGSHPPRSVLNPLSGSLYDYIQIVPYSSPHAFLDYAKINNIGLVAAEISENSRSILNYDFNFDKPLCLVVGQEECGVPVDILVNSEKVCIPMPGVGYCLNTSQAANIFLYEAIKQYTQRSIVSFNEERIAT